MNISIGPLGLFAVAVAGAALAFFSNAFVDWALDRHHKWPVTMGVLGPVAILLMCAGIIAVFVAVVFLLALATS